ncbi:MAG TPA: hypothetical protein VKB52_05895 [Rhodanobacteraceae bacterium]|nr:hypothetical protein [Rhodanobacteraceae bacterium]
MNSPTPVTPPPPKRGSLGLGIGLAWAMLVGGYIVSALLANAFLYNNDGAFVVFMLLPWIGEIVLIGWFAQRGQPRTAIGVAIGIGTIVAVALLLVAACFGLLAGSGFH